MTVLAIEEVTADVGSEIERITGSHHDAERVEAPDEIEAVAGPLRSLTAGWEDVQRTRLALDQRGIPSDGMKLIEDRLGRQIRREMERHPVWPWLAQYPGLGGVHTARLIALIGDPHRFPGRQCAAGHHHSAADGVSEIEAERGCGYELADGTVCAAPVGPVRRGTGTRSLWHYLGLHVVEGRTPRRQKGHRADWNPKGRTAVLMPGGIAEQIVRQRVPVYRDIYDQTKERLTRERAEGACEIEGLTGSLTLVEGPEVDTPPEIAAIHGLRPFQIDAIARKVGAKAFVGDLLRAWKEAAPLT